jgi:hypothetical protein
LLVAGDDDIVEAMDRFTDIVRAGSKMGRPTTSG